MFSALCRRLLALGGFVFRPGFQRRWAKPYPGSSYRDRFSGRMTERPLKCCQRTMCVSSLPKWAIKATSAASTRYIYTTAKRKNWHNATGSTVIAAHEGRSRQQIIIMAHLIPMRP
jgi:alkaline phosphatase isozyme conversion protein